MEMTFQQYIDNPLGKRNAVFSQRDLYKALYTDKFNKILLREAGKIDYTLYIDKKRDRYVIHIKVPSETVKDFYYDAVVLFYSNDPAVKVSPNLQGYYVKFFSNDPAFVYTYLRVFLKNDLFFEDLRPRSSSLALRKDPKEKNPYEIPGYSKILYFAFLYMKAKNLFAKTMYDSYAEPYSTKKLLDRVEHTDKKIAARQEEGQKQERIYRAEQRKKAKEASSPRREVMKSAGSPNRGSSNVKTARSAKSAKQSPTAKTVKTVKKK